MKYKAKRFRAGLSTYTVAKELGIEWNKYLDVERGKIALEGKYIDEFQNVLKNAKMIKFNRRQRLEDIKRFIKEGKLSDLMAKRGYNGMSLARAMDLDTSVIKEVMDGTNSSDDMNEYVYDFLQNSLNANTDVKEENERYDQDDDKEISFEELRKLKNEKGFSMQDISNGIDMPVSTLSHILGGRKAKPENLQKIYDFLMNNEKSKEGKNALEAIMVEKKISKMDVAKALGINYSYVYNFLKGVNIKKEYAKKIEDYILSVEGKKVRKNEPFELNLKEINAIIKDKEISYNDICKALRISYSYINKLLSDRIIGSFDTKRELDEFVRNYEPQEELTECIDNVEDVKEPIIDEFIEDTTEIDVPNVNDSETTENAVIDIEDLIADGVIKDEVQSRTDKNYFDLLKEVADLKEELARAKKQIKRYEVLIDMIGGSKNDN